MLFHERSSLAGKNKVPYEQIKDVSNLIGFTCLYIELHTT
jgi:hypothetical protein